MTHTIRYRRPEAPSSIVVMAVPGGPDAVWVQIVRLKALGYAVHDVTPPLTDPVQGGLPKRAVPDAA